MLRMIRKNLKNQYTKQTLLALLMLVNIAVTALVICFAYGIYYDFAIKADHGMAEFRSTGFSIAADLGDVTEHEEFSDYDSMMGKTHAYTGTLTASKLINFVKTLPDELKNNLEYFGAEVVAMSSLHFHNTSTITWVWDDGVGTAIGSTPDDRSDNDEPYYGRFYCQCEMKDGKICARSEGSYMGQTLTFSDDTGSIDDRVIPEFTDEEYDSGTDFIFVNENRLDQTLDDDIEEYDSMNANQASVIRVIPEGTTKAVIGGKEYDIKYYQSEGFTSDDIVIPLTSFSDEAMILGTTFYEGWLLEHGEKSPEYADFASLTFKKPITRDQFNLLSKCIREQLGDEYYIPNVTLLEEHEMQMLRTVALIAVLIALLAAIDVAILYRYMLEKRSGQLAIMRICGCSKGKAIAAYVIENIIINAPLFALSELAFHKLILPHLKGLYPTMGERYTLKGYILIFIWYIVISLIVMLAMVIHTVRKHSLIQLKNSSRSVKKFSMMKVFEIIQLSVVLGIMTLSVSSALARYDTYRPIEKLISGNGYIIGQHGFDDTSIFEDIPDAKISAIFSGDQMIPNEETEDEYDTISMKSIAMAGGYITDYRPEMQDGVWLSECTNMYAETGVIPVVLGWCNGRYNVGDEFSHDYMMNYDENGNPTKIVHARYKIVGIMANGQRLIGYSDHTDWVDIDYTDIATLYDYNVDERIFAITMIADSEALFGGKDTSCIYYQMADYSDLSYEEYANASSRIEGNNKYQCYPFAKVRENSMKYVFEQIRTLMPIAVCIFLLMIISAISVNAIYTKRQLRNYAIFYICGARWRSCALKSLKNELVTCGFASALTAAVLIIGKYTFLKKMLVSFGLPQLGLCAAVIVLYLTLSVIMPLCIIGSSQPKDVLKEE